MKTKNIRRTFFNLRVIIASLFCLTAGMLTLVALAGAPQPANNTQTTHSSRWLSRLATTLGIQSSTDHFAGGGAIKTDQYPAERPPGAQTAPAIPYSGPPHDLTPVRAVHTGKLRDMRPIETVKNYYHLEPIPPKPPTRSGGVRGPQQRTAGPMSPAGLNFEGVGV